MRRLILTVTLLLPSLLFASSVVELEKSPNDINDQVSLQAGAKLYVNYCLGCHSADYVRFQRVGQDLGFTDEELKTEIMFTADKVGETMNIALDKDAAKRWFGVTPPDLSVIARARGTDWLYTYLLGFYLDPSRPFGANNIVFQDVGMPHVLWELQGWQKAIHKTDTGADGQPHETTVLELVDKDSMTADEHSAKIEKYRENVRDLVNFLDYIGEPAKLQRQSLGWKVMLFIFIFGLIAYALKKEYWRDVH